MRPVFTLPVPDTTLWCLDWSPDSRRLACGFDGGKLIVWDLAAVRERLATVELAWDAPEYHRLEPMEPLSALLTTGHSESAAKQSRHWVVRMRQLSEWAGSDEPVPTTLAEDVEALFEGNPLGDTNRFTIKGPLANRIDELVKLAIDLKSRGSRPIAASLLSRTIDLAESLDNPDAAIRLSLSSAHHALGNLHTFSPSDNLRVAVKAYKSEQELLEQLLANGGVTEVTVPSYRLFWMNRNYAIALAGTDNRVAGIERLDKALALQEHDPSITVSDYDLASDYETLINWLKLENRNVDAEAIRKRARKIGVLSE
jgi:hypothetical protein